MARIFLDARKFLAVLSKELLHGRNSFLGIRAIVYFGFFREGVDFFRVAPPPLLTNQNIRNTHIKLINH